MLSISILPVEKCQMISTAITAQKKHRRGFYVSQTYGAIQVVRSRRTHRRCGHHDGPVEQRMVAFCGHLSGESHAKKSQKKNATEGVPEVRRHRRRIAAGFANRCRKDLDCPERERDLRYLTPNTSPCF